MNDLDLAIREMKDNATDELAKVEEYGRIIKNIANWFLRDTENNLSASEFIFYEPAYPYISETFFEVLEKLREFKMKYYAYSSCIKDKDGNPVLFYRLIIPLKKGE